MKPSALLFDWDNTLVNTWPIIHHALHHTFSEMGMTPWTMEETKARVRHSMRDSFPKLFGDKWEAASNLYQERYKAVHLEKLQALEGAEDVLKFLRATGIYMAVVSNKKGGNLRTEVEHIGWAPYFDTVVGADDAENDKPSAAPVKLALKQSSIALNEHIWFIGDSVIDLECAKNAGCSAIIYGDITTEQLGEAKDGLYQGFPYIHHTLNHASFLEWLKTRMG